MQQLPGLQVGLACCADNIADSGKEPPSSILRICNMRRPGVFLRAFICAVDASDKIIFVLPLRQHFWVVYGACLSLRS
jgi:hypothetical protein